eukprot:TRINITY_DN6332_c0_g2_i3.p1 TRINITY_DN6332_c0_g2~~TRINITY_DN6332_c0_g2_i3.p1  ORF type:complete len:116 (-),score=13.61 TRINITY_DN6332_c0_g2_i3:75-422(-)
MSFTKQVISKGNGVLIQPKQSVTVSADLYLAKDNTAIWSTHKQGFLFPATGPFEYKAATGSVIKGWDDGCMTMSLGERARLQIPWAYAYGERGHPGFKIPGKADLIFEIEILSVR